MILLLWYCIFKLVWNVIYWHGSTYLHIIVYIYDIFPDNNTSHWTETWCCWMIKVGSWYNNGLTNATFNEQEDKTIKCNASKIPLSHSMKFSNTSDAKLNSKVLPLDSFELNWPQTTWIQSLSTNTGRSLHCHVENHVRTKKKSTFSKLHHQNGSNFYQLFFMSRYTWYLLHGRSW